MFFENRGYMKFEGPCPEISEKYGSLVGVFISICPIRIDLGKGHTTWKCTDVILSSALSYWFNDDVANGAGTSALNCCCWLSSLIMRNSTKYLSQSTKWSAIQQAIGAYLWVLLEAILLTFAFKEESTNWTGADHKEDSLWMLGRWG